MQSTAGSITCRHYPADVRVSWPGRAPRLFRPCRRLAADRAPVRVVRRYAALIPRAASSLCSSCSMCEPARSIYGDAERSQTTRRTPGESSACEAIQDRFQDGISIDVDQRRFGTEGDHAGQHLVFGMTGDVGVAVRAGNAAEERHVRPRHARPAASRWRRAPRAGCLAGSPGAARRRARWRQRRNPAGSRATCGVAPENRAGPDTAVSTTAASTAFGRFSRQPREKKQTQRERHRGEDQGERGARARLVVHCRLRQAAGHGIALSHRRGEICRADAEKFLSRVQVISVLCSEGAGGGDAFNIGEQQASGGQRKNTLDVAQPERRAFQGGQASRNLLRSLAPREREAQATMAATIDSATIASATGLPGRKRSPSTSSRIAMTPTASTRMLDLAELPGKQHGPLEEIVPAAGHAEQARQLGHGDRQSRTGLEAHEDTVADQFDQHAQPQEPGEQAKYCHREGREAGDLRIALHVPVRHRAHRSGNHERDGGRRVRPPAGATTRAERSRARPAGSRTRRPAAASPRVPHRRGKPGSRRPQA